MSLNNIALGKRIREKRKAKGLTQDALSDMINCVPNYISYIENGRKGMSIDMLVSIANALETSTDELLKDSLRCFRKVAATDLEECLADCDHYESRVIIEIVDMTKKALRENRRFLSAVK